MSYPARPRRFFRSMLHHIPVGLRIAFLAVVACAWLVTSDRKSVV